MFPNHQLLKPFCLTYRQDTTIDLVFCCNKIPNGGGGGNGSNHEWQVCPLLKIFEVNTNHLYIITHDNSTALLLGEPTEQG